MTGGHGPWDRPGVRSRRHDVGLQYLDVGGLPRALKSAHPDAHDLLSARVLAATAADATLARIVANDDLSRAVVGAQFVCG